MKLTLEPTTEESYWTVVISKPKDDLKLDEVMELVKAAVVAWGFSPESVEEYWR